MIALDSTAIIDFFKKDEKLKKVLDNVDDTLVTTSINYQEVRFGMNPKDPRYKLEHSFYEELFDNIVLFDFDRRSALKSAEIFWELINNGMEIGKFDSMISGTLLNNGVNSIITKNKSHFERVKGLKVLSY